MTTPQQSDGIRRKYVRRPASLDVIDALAEGEPMSRMDIFVATGRSVVAVNSAVQELLGMRLIQGAGTRPNRYKGTPEQLFRLHKRIKVAG